MNDKKTKNQRVIAWEHPSLGRLNVSVVFKRMKSLRIHVSESGDVWVSAPIGTPIASVVSSLDAGADFIGQAKKKQLARPRASERERDRVTILGKEHPVRIIRSEKVRAEIAGGEVRIYMPNTGDINRAEKLLDAALRRDMLDFFNDSLSRLYPAVAYFGAKKPTVSVRRMKTLWGSCSKEKLRIHLNTYLYEAPPACVDYVVMHELTHLLYGYHDDDFYGFMDRCMPDWRKRKTLLEASVVIPI